MKLANLCIDYRNF